MELTIAQKPEIGFLGGPKDKCFQVCHNSINYTVIINQCGERQITLKSCEDGTIRDMLYVYYSLETFLMLLDGQFYPVISAFENDIEITHSWKKRTLPSYHSANFMIGTENILADFNAVLNIHFFQNWSNLREELDLIHKMVLYCLSSVEMPKDMQCAFMAEAFEGLGELIHEKKPAFVLPKVNSGESRLQKYFLTIIPTFGALIFEKEMQSNIEAFTQILVNSRNRIAHIKSKQDRVYFSNGENVMYLMKLSLLYRVILFNLLGIPETLYKDKLSLRVQAIDNHEVTQNFLKRLNKYL